MRGKDEGRERGSGKCAEEGEELVLVMIFLIKVHLVSENCG